MEASALQAPARLTRGRVGLGSPLLRLRSDEQLVELFRAGNDEAFRVIHDRYRSRLLTYMRQMLHGARQDAEDALQDVFIKAYAGLRANDRTLALRAWLYRVAHNRCIDELRRPAPIAWITLESPAGDTSDPIIAAEQREAIRRLICDIHRLPDQQRSALLMRELSGMSYNDLAVALGVSVPAVKSLLVRARISLAQALEARDTACSAIREELILAHDRGVRPNGTARRHLHDCESCREFRGELRLLRRQFAALVPALGPIGVIAKVLGVGGGASGGAAASGSAAAGGGAAVAATGVVGTGGAVAATGILTTTAGHVATLLAAAIVTAGSAVELPPVLAGSAHHKVAHVATSAIATVPVGQASTETATPLLGDTASATGAGAARDGRAAAAREKRTAAGARTHTRGGVAGTSGLNSAAAGATGSVAGTGVTGDTAGGTPTGTGTLTGTGTTTGTGTDTGTGTGSTGTDTGTGTGTGTTVGTPTGGTGTTGTGTQPGTTTDPGTTTTTTTTGTTSSPPTGGTGTGGSRGAYPNG